MYHLKLFVATRHVLDLEIPDKGLKDFKSFYNCVHKVVERKIDSYIPPSRARVAIEIYYGKRNSRVSTHVLQQVGHGENIDSTAIIIYNEIIAHQNLKVFRAIGT